MGISRMRYDVLEVQHTLSIGGTIQEGVLRVAEGAERKACTSTVWISVRGGYDWPQCERLGLKGITLTPYVVPNATIIKLSFDTEPRSPWIVLHLLSVGDDFSLINAATSSPTGCRSSCFAKVLTRRVLKTNLQGGALPSFRLEAASEATRPSRRKPLPSRDADPSEDDQLARILYNAFLPVW